MNTEETPGQSWETGGETRPGFTEERQGQALQKRHQARAGREEERPGQASQKRHKARAGRGEERQGQGAGAPLCSRCSLRQRGEALGGRLAPFEMLRCGLVRSTADDLPTGCGSAGQDYSQGFKA